MFSPKVATTLSLISVVSVKINIKKQFGKKPYMIKLFLKKLCVMCPYIRLYSRGIYVVTFSKTEDKKKHTNEIMVIKRSFKKKKKTICFPKTCNHKCFYLPLVALSLPPVVVGLASVLCDDSTVLWTVVCVLSYVLSVAVVMVMSIKRNKQ